MRTVLATATLLLIGVAAGTTCAPAGQGSQAAPPRGLAESGPATLSSVLDTELRIVEFEFVGAADAMPEDNYSFAPTNGEFKGVRTFAQQVKHVATTNNRFFSAILGQTQPKAASEFEAENGPDSIRTKAQIMQYLRDSFALGHKAIATINAENAFTPMDNSPTPFLKTRTAVAIFACAHALDHYGQMVEYLRDNGIVPPASRNRAPANPAK
jgi:uncharacterized damage-inducible protein DinB